MNQLKQSLIHYRDDLFDRYLDLSLRIECWRNGKYEFKTQHLYNRTYDYVRHKRGFIELLQAELDVISSKLRKLDDEICPVPSNLPSIYQQLRDPV
jgi:hypothetical protein